LVKAVEFSKEAHKTLTLLQKSSPKNAKAVARRILELRNTGITAHCKMLRNSSPPVFRSRCGDYRVVFELTEHKLNVLAIGHRRDIYSHTRNKGLT
jgi:mRNA interferase RelE/StbE